MGIKYAVNEKFFDTWSMQMAYILGFLYADGHLEDSPNIRGKYVRVINTDPDRVEIIRELLQSRHIISIRKDAGTNHKPAFLLRIGSYRLYNRLCEIGMTPRKSLTMKFPDVPAKYLSSFVRGYFDGDGCVHLERYEDNGKIRPAKRMRTIFTSGSKKFLEMLSKVLRAHAGIDKYVLHKHTKKGSFQLRLSSENSVRLFMFMYSTALPRLYLKRKCAIFTQYFKERPEWVNVKVRRTLKHIQ